MPSKSKPASDRVLVRHVSGAEKYVRAERVRSLSPRWKQVTKRPASKPADSNPETPASPAPSKED